MVAGEQHVADLDPFDLLDAESERVRAFFDSDPDWGAPTRCEGWGVRELLAHVDGVEVYHTACLDDRVQEIFEEGGKHGATDLDSFNDWMVRSRADRSTEDLLASWSAANADVRRRLRERGRDGMLSSSVGPYPCGAMAFHIASEYATHADDMGIEIPEEERAARTAWRAQVSRFAIEESGKDVTLERDGDRWTAHSGDAEASLTDDALVEAACGRLPAGAIPDAIRDALRALA